jgi:hypothetical protein
VLGLLLTVGGSISGCVSKDTSIQFRGVRIVDFYDQRELSMHPDIEVLVGRQAADNYSPGERRPHLLQLRVEFSSKDLWGVAQRGVSVYVVPFICSRPNDEGIAFDLEVFFNGERISSVGSRNQSSMKRERTYYFYAHVARKDVYAVPRNEDPDDAPPQMVYDLRTNPEDICFRVEGMGIPILGLVYKSAGVRVPRSDIESAVREARNLVESTPVDWPPVQ